MSENIIIISAGKMGRVTYSWLEDAIAAGRPWKIKGFLDDRKDLLEKFNYEAPILAGPDEYEPEADDRFLCAIGGPRINREYGEKILRKGGQFATLVHPTASVGKNAKLGAGVIVGPFTAIDPDVTINDYVTILAHANIGHDTVVGEWAQICSHCFLGGNVQIGELAYVASNACLTPSARVGAGAYVGACSLVLRRVAPGTKVFGVPALPIGTVD